MRAAPRTARSLLCLALFGVIGAFGVSFGAAGCLDTRVVYHCRENRDCHDNGTDGVCEPDKLCSFPDPDCKTGRRYADLVPAGKAAACTLCGNGVTDPGEACDDGNQDNTDACLTTCEWNVCGDGHVRAGVEECDDGNRVNGDGCSRSCLRCRMGDESFVWDGNDACYFRRTEPTTWEAAQQACEEAGAHLVSVSADAEATAVGMRLLPSALGPHWIGLRDERRNGNFTWVTSEPFLAQLSFWSRAMNRMPGHCIAQRGSSTWLGELCTNMTAGYACELPRWAIRRATNRAYRIFHARVTWAEARKRCEDLGAHLATINDADEGFFVASQFNGNYWLGAVRETGARSSAFNWVTEEPFNYRDFAPGDPNESLSMPACLVMSEDRKWRDRVCDMPNPFVCERP